MKIGGEKNIDKFSLAKCPYCGEEIWYVEAFLAKNKAAYKCKYCEQISQVKVKSETFKFLGIVEIVSIIIFAASIFISEEYCILGTALIIMIFSGFYAFSPFMVLLFKPKNEKQKDEFDDVFIGTKKQSGKDTDTEIYSN